jgi:magnesium-transporting ATPase (P-type)
MENRVFVFVKGADNVITERLKNKDDTENKKLKLVKHQLDEWSVNGLRTLVFAKRVIKK